MPTRPGACQARRREGRVSERSERTINRPIVIIGAGLAGLRTAEELRRAQAALGEITAPLDADALLGRIFAGFCIGK